MTVLIEQFIYKCTDVFLEIFLYSSYFIGIQSEKMTTDKEHKTDRAEKAKHRT